MSTQKYSVNQYLIETLLAWVKSGEIAIPEIQRPFVWDATQVRDLLDSLYQGYPVGYIIVGKTRMFDSKMALSLLERRFLSIASNASLL